MKHLMLVLTILVGFILADFASSSESECFGSTSNGYLKNGVQLPEKGNNYEGYSLVARMAGRTYVHSKVHDIMLAAYKQLETEQANKVFKYAETGFKEGGQFKPHKTHRNGLSVDFMVPVLNKQGQSVHLPTHIGNKFGYNIEFDHQGRYKEFNIDYSAMAAHIVALHQAATSQGHELWRVIFDPKLQKYLFNTEYAAYLKQHIQFSSKASWVRHDEHYHVDFKIPCKKI